jgi:hypothetical protein
VFSTAHGVEIVLDFGEALSVAHENGARFESVEAVA